MMDRRVVRWTAAGVVAAGAAVAIVPLRAASCGPNPTNLWCYSEPFFGSWQACLFAAGVIVGLLLGPRLGLPLVLAATMGTLLALATMDPLASMQDGTLTIPMVLNMLIMGGPAALAGYLAGWVARKLLTVPRRPVDPLRW